MRPATPEPAGAIRSRMGGALGPGRAGFRGGFVDVTFFDKTYAQWVASSARWSMNRAPVVLAIAGFLFAAATVTVLESSLDPSPERYLAGTKIWEEYSRIDDEYEIGETLVVAFREVGGTVFDVETVVAVAALDRALSKISGVERVLSIASATALDRENDVLDLTPLLPAGPITKDTAIKLSARIRRHPVYGQALVDAPHETTFVFVQLSSDAKDPFQRIEAVREIRSLADGFRAKHRTVHLAGTPVAKEAIASAVHRDAFIFLPAVILILAIALWLVFGDATAIVVVISAIAFSSTTALSVLAALHVPINLTTAAVPIFLLIVGLSEAVQFLCELRRQHQRSGHRETSIAATVQALAVPCLVTTTAGALGFLALGLAEIRPLRELGYTITIGLVALYVTMMVIVPALLRVLRLPRSRLRPFESAARLGRACSRFALGTRRRMIVGIAFAGLASGVAIAALVQIRVESNLVAYLDEDHRLRDDIAIIERTLGGADALELILDGKGPGFFKQTSELARLDRLGRSLQGHEDIHTAFSLADYLKIANAVMVGGADAKDRLPESQEAVAQLMVIDPTPFSAFTDAEMQQARMGLQIRSLSSEEALELAALVKARADQVLRDSGIRVTVTGLPVAYAQVVRMIVRDALGTFALAFLLTWLILTVALRSISIATFCMAPGVIMAALTVSTMAVVGIHADANLIFVISVALGIGLSQAVHLATRYQRAREQGSPRSDSAVQYALTHAGHPAVITSAVLVVSLGALALSSFRPTMLAGLLGAILVLLALVLDLAVLPALLMAADWLENRYGISSAKGAGPIGHGIRRMSSLLTSAQPAPSNDLRD